MTKLSKKAVANGCRVECKLLFWPEYVRRRHEDCQEFNACDYELVSNSTPKLLT